MLQLVETGLLILQADELVLDSFIFRSCTFVKNNNKIMYSYRTSIPLLFYFLF